MLAWVMPSRDVVAGTERVPQHHAGRPLQGRIIYSLLSVGTGVAGTHGYYKGDASGVINHMLILYRFFSILPIRATEKMIICRPYRA